MRKIRVLDRDDNYVEFYQDAITSVNRYADRIDITITNQISYSVSGHRMPVKSPIWLTTISVVDRWYWVVFDLCRTLHVNINTLR